MSSSHQKGFPWLSVLLGVLILIAIATMVAPLETKYAKMGDRTKALLNAKAIAAALMAFKQEYGAYPCEGTRKILEADRIDFLPPGKDANAYLAQLIASETIDSETAFFAPGAVAGAKEGDNIKESPEKLLERGENGFAYIMAEDKRPLTDTKSATPLVIAPIKQGGDNPIFDDGPYGGKYVMGLADGSSKAGHIDENGHAKSEEGKNLFRSGPDSLFGKDKPVIKTPTGIN